MKYWLTIIFYIFIGFIIFLIFGSIIFNMHTSGIKKALSKQNHYIVLKFVAAELGKCSLGRVTAMEGNLTCNEITAPSVAAATIKYFSSDEHFKNPYSPNESAIKTETTAVYDTSGFSDTNVGYVFVQGSDKGSSSGKIIILSCFKKTCYGSENTQISIIDINDKRSIRRALESSPY